MQYACRKTLADSRPRVRGRFAKNDDFGDTNRTASSNHEEEDEEEVIRFQEHILIIKHIPNRTLSLYSFNLPKSKIKKFPITYKLYLFFQLFVGIIFNPASLDHNCAYR